jgi:hypothetical protein
VTTVEKKPAIDWEAIERDYRTGTRSTREIAAVHGLSHTAINKRAKTEGWARDLSKAIKAKADAKVSRAAVSKEVSKETKILESEVVEANAHAIAEIRLAHRADIRRGRALVLQLLTELEGQTAGRELFENLGELMKSPDENGRDRLNELYHKVIGLSGRVSNVKSLTEALKNLVALEREAWGLGTAEPPKGDASMLSDDELDAELHVRLGAARAA